MGRTNLQVLEAVKNHGISDRQCSDISSQDIVACAQTLAEKVQPQTVGNYLAHLGSVFAIAPAARGYDLQPQAMADAVQSREAAGSDVEIKSSR
jgi:hypothetical protein